MWKKIRKLIVDQPFWFVMVALPVLQIINAAKYAGARRTNAGAIGIFLLFVPLIALMTMIWCGVWLIAIYLCVLPVDLLIRS